MQSIIRITGDRKTFVAGTRFGTATGSGDVGSCGDCPSGKYGIRQFPGRYEDSRYDSGRELPGMPDYRDTPVPAECTRMGSENGRGEVPPAA